MLVNSKEILIEAKSKRFAVPSTNFIDLNSARTYVKVAGERNFPLFLSFAQSHSEFISLEEAALIGKYLADSVNAPIILHLDHGEDYDFIKKAIDLGFTSVMIDASQESFENNVAITRKVVEYAHQHNVTVEAELGHVGANENFEAHEVADSIYTEVSDVIDFVEQTNVDSLAISIGTAHGAYKGEPKINFERLEEINKITDIPLVLHGGSSSGDSNLERCALNGISKINIFTDFLNGAFDSITDNKPTNYIELKQYADQGMYEVLDHYFKVFHTQPVK